MYDIVEPPQGEVHERAGGDACNGVPEVVGLYVDGGEEHECAQRQNGEEEPAAALLAGQPQQHGGDAHVARREGGRGALAGVVGCYEQLVEQTVGPSGYGQRLLVLAEVVAHLRADAQRGLVGAYGFEVELWSCHGKDDEDSVEDEEGTEDDEGCLPDALRPGEEEVAHGEHDERIVAHVAQGHQLAHHGVAEADGPHQRRLAAEGDEVPVGHEVVEVEELAVELKRVGIPPPEPQQLVDYTRYHDQAAGEEDVGAQADERGDHAPQSAAEHAVGGDVGVRV